MDDIFPDIRLRGGHPLVDLAAEVKRPLVEVDMQALVEGADRDQPTPPLKRIADRHHALARNLASGMTINEAALICGFHPTRVSLLKDDPQFKELLAFYREETNLVYRDMHEKLAGVASIALDELQERLEDAPEKFSVSQLQETVKLGADRTGYGPQSSTTNVNVNVDMASRLQAARQRIAARQQTVDHE